MYPESYRSSTGAEVLALQVREDTIDDICQWTGGTKVKLNVKNYSTLPLGVRIETVSGPRIARHKDWVVQYKNQELYFYVLGSAEFEVSYTNI